MKHLYYIILFFSFSKVCAQHTFYGIVTEKQNGKPIFGASVSIPELGKAASTDHAGNFRIENINSVSFLAQISHLGYHPLRVTIKNTDNAQNFTLSADTLVLDEVLVSGQASTGYRSEQAYNGPLGKLNIKDAPYSIHVTSGELIANRSAHTLSDALQTNPTAALLMSSNTYSSLSRMMIRGFTAADQSELRDGMVDRSFTFPHLENVERIEVLNGLSSFLYGFSAIGGTINYISKKPTPTQMATLSLGSYGGGIKYIHADLGGPMVTNGRLGYRVNAYHEDGGTYIKNGKQQRTLISAVFDYRLSENIHLTADITQQDYLVKGLQTYFLPAAGTTKLPAAFDPGKQYGQDWTNNESKKTQLGVGMDAKINKIFSVRAAFRYNDMWRKYSYVAAKLTEAGKTGYQETYWDSPRQYETTHSGYAYLDANFKTSFLTHALTFGYTGTEYLYKRGVDVNVILGTSNIDAPVVFAIPSYAGGLTTFQKQTMQNIQLNDRITLGRMWQAVLGINYASLKQEAGGIYTGISTSNFSQSRFTPSFSLIFKPVSSISVYGSYMQGIASGGTAPMAAKNANVQLAPSVSDQYELGVKASTGAIDFTLALFRINKINEYTDPSDTLYKQDGRQVHQGIEFTTTGKLTRDLTLVGGFTLMKAQLTKAANNPAIENKIPINVPRQQVRVYLEYAFPWVSGLVVSGGPNYFGKRPANALNTLFLPAVTTVDAGLRYQFVVKTHKMNVHMNIANLLDKAYWANYRDGDGLQLGAPRIISFGLKFSL